MKPSAATPCASDALGSWTIGNLEGTGIGGDGISIAGSAEAQVTTSDNEFERIDGNGISTKMRWDRGRSPATCRRPISGHAMHFHNQSGAGFAQQQLGQRLGARCWSAAAPPPGRSPATRSAAGKPVKGRAGGFEFVGLSAQSTLTCTDNTLSHVGGVAMSFMNSKAAKATVANNAINNAWGDQGGPLLSNQGIGLMAVDGFQAPPSPATRSRTTTPASSLIWRGGDSVEDGVAQLGLTGNTIRGHNNRRQIISQSIPAGANVDGFAALHAANGLVAPRTPGGVVVERSEPPPRCGDGQVDARRGL